MQLFGLHVQKRFWSCLVISPFPLCSPKTFVFYTLSPAWRLHCFGIMYVSRGQRVFKSESVFFKIKPLSEGDHQWNRIHYLFFLCCSVVGDHCFTSWTTTSSFHSAEWAKRVSYGGKLWHYLLLYHLSWSSSDFHWRLHCCVCSQPSARETSLSTTTTSRSRRRRSVEPYRNSSTSTSSTTSWTKTVSSDLFSLSLCLGNVCISSGCGYRGKFGETFLKCVTLR